MTNLNSNGTGTLLSNQYTNRDMSFVPPPPSTLGPGFESQSYDPGQEAPPQNKPQIVDLSKIMGKGYEGCFWVRFVLNHNQRGYRQVGTYSRDNGKRADGALYSDGRGYLCLPPLTTQQTPGVPLAATADRISSATAEGIHLFTGFEAGTANLFRETSSTNPAVIAVAGYAPPAGVNGINAIRSIMINGINYLAICFQNGGAGNSIQILININTNPPTSAAIPVGAVPTYDLIQTAIDGNALLVYTTDALGNGCIKAIRTDVGAGTVVLSAARCQITPGGYAVGLSDAEDGVPMPYWVEPLDGNWMGFNLTGAGVTNRGRLIKTDARGYLPVTVDVPLRWVTFATKWRGGIVVCDTNTHWYLNRLNRQNPYSTHGKWRRMSVFDDFVADSDKQYVCCGHHEKDGRFVVEANETITASGTGATKRYGIEFDYDTWSATRIEAKSTLTTTGVLSKGGASLPWSPFTNFKQVRAETSWYRQRIGPLGENLYNMRKTSGAAAGTGVEYASEESLTWPAMDIEGLEDCAKTLVGVAGPKPAAVATGGTGAYVLVEDLLSGRTGAGPNGNGAQFFGTEPTERVQYRAYKNISWTYQVQPRVTLVRQSGGTDPTRQTPNAFNNSIYMDYIAVKDSIHLTKDQSDRLLKAMDRQRKLPTP